MKSSYNKENFEKSCGIVIKTLVTITGLLNRTGAQLTNLVVYWVILVIKLLVDRYLHAGSVIVDQKYLEIQYQIFANTIIANNSPLDPLISPTKTCHFITLNSSLSSYPVASITERWQPWDRDNKIIIIRTIRAATRRWYRCYLAAPSDGSPPSVRGRGVEEMYR